MLPRHYDSEGASKRLDELINENLSDPIIGVPFPSEWAKTFVYGGGAFDCVPYGHPETYRVAIEGNEVTFRMIGAVDDTALPPFDRHRLRQSAKLQYLQQGISLNIVQSRRSSSDMEALTDILDAVSRTVPLAVDQSITSISDKTIRFSNRLFAHSDENRPQNVVPLPFFVDPQGAIRAKADEAGLVHTDDNVVEFFRVICNKYTTTTPAAIRRGDIVETRFSVALFTNSTTSVMFRLILRAVIILDTEYARMARKTKQNVNGSIPETTLKRKRVMDDTGVDGNRVTKVPRTGRDATSPVRSVASPGDGSASPAGSAASFTDNPARQVQTVEYVDSTVQLATSGILLDDGDVEMDGISFSETP